jgi:hypothetical protein
VICRECGKQVSDQAESCPNCGIKSPALVTLPESAVPPQNTNEVILALDTVVITRTLAKFKSQTFPINGIGSVTLLPPKRAGMIIFGSILALLAIGAFSGGTAGGGMFFLIFAGVVFAIAFSRNHGLFIKTASGDVRAMEGDEKVLETVKQAIERAATMRG